MSENNTSFPRRHRSPRLTQYDYSQDGAYFITICLQNHHCLFGDVYNDDMALNDAGHMINDWVNNLSSRFMNFMIDSSVVMPNHVHLLVIIEKGNQKTSLSDTVAWFKTMTTNAYIRGVKEHGWKRFEGKFWQRSFHDHIIRNDRTLRQIREYIRDNPARWALDKLNPHNIK